jgi:hypothetical protein
VSLNRSVQRFFARLAVLGLLSLGVLPVEHVHTIQTADSHHTEVAHRHFDPHHDDHDEPADADHDAAVSGLDDHDNAVWIVSSFTTPGTSSHICSFGDLLQQGSSIVEVPRTIIGMVPPDAPQSDHDPPWARSLGPRAPPAPLV